MNLTKKKLLIILTLSSCLQVFPWIRHGYYRGGYGYGWGGDAALAGGIIGGAMIGSAIANSSSNESPESLDANRRRKAIQRQIDNKNKDKRNHQKKYDKTGDQYYLKMIEQIDKDIRRLQDQLAIV